MLSSSILATKILLISSGVVFLAMMMKVTIIPWLINFSVYELPIIWSFLVSLCRPPYLYIVINGIIITIVASSRFTRTGNEMESSSSMPPSSSFEHFQPLISVRTPPKIETRHDMIVDALAHRVVEEVAMVDDNKVVNVENPVEKVELVAEEVVQVEFKDKEVEKDIAELVEGAALPRRTYMPPQPEVVSPVTEKPRALLRFGPQKPSKACPQGKREVKMERESIDGQPEVTLESMWKMIMEGREEPFDQLMKTSGPFDNSTRKEEDESPGNETSSTGPIRARPSSQDPKLRSLNGRARYICESPVKSWILKKEPSLGQDELNRRADTFIQQFNEEMRMQRQQSLMQNLNR